MSPSSGMVFAQAEPSASAWEHGADFAVRKTAEHPDVVFPLLAILGPVVVGCAFIWAAVKYGLPFVKDELAAFRAHTADMLKRRDDDAAGDIAAARALAKEQHSAIVEKIGNEVSRHTGELAKLVDRSDKHGELLRSVAAKVGVGLALCVLLAVALGKVYSLYAVAAPSCRCDPPCSAGMRCTCEGCKEIKTTTTITANKPHSALGLAVYANIASFNCPSVQSACN